MDTENILGILKDRLYPIVSEVEEAETVIVNTCGFIQAAVEETIESILEMVEEKKKGNIRRIFVIGCFVQRYGYKLRRELPEVDGWLGTSDHYRILELLEGEQASPSHFIIGRPSNLADHQTPRLRTTPFYSAYLKIAEGCSHRCSFCTIPALRGPLRSRSLESLHTEAAMMAESGVKELNLIAQDTTQYGHDLPGATGLEDLIEMLLTIKELRWIRLLYAYPSGISDRLLELLEEDGLCSYLDLPLQHVNKDILAAMGRPLFHGDPRQWFENLVARNPGVVLRTTLMVGFPGETASHFQELLDFVKIGFFYHVGTFIYSREKGTPAARLDKEIPMEIAQARRDELMGLQGRIRLEKNRKQVGQTVSVLVEGHSSETELLLKGRTQAMAPDVDGQVLINEGHGQVGNIVPVKIREAHTYDLIGMINRS